MKINGVDISSWGVLTNLEIGEPEPKTRYVDIPFGDGSLDMTEALGFVRYKDRLIKASFVLKDYNEIKYHETLNQYHGQKVKFSVDDDWYFEGRIRFTPFVRLGTAGTYSFEMIADPYRYANEETIVNITSTTTEQSVIFINDRMKVVPEITTDSNVQIFHKSNSWSVSEGTWTLPIVFEEGENTINFKGDATVKVKYRKGRL